jgi:hypothetical protein
MNATWGFSLWPTVYLGALAGIAVPLRRRVEVLGEFGGVPGYLLALGITLFGAVWGNFLLYVLLGWGELYVALSWGAVVIAGAVLVAWPRLGGGGWTPRAPGDALRVFRETSPWFWGFGAVVVSRFYFGLRTDAAGQLWCNFNFVDTAFHLSVGNAFLESPDFPPTDLDLAPFPLKYHFLADFHVAHLTRLGAVPLEAMALMNVVSGAILAGSLWAFFSRVLGLAARWIFLAGMVFLFLSLPLVNLVHYLWLKPAFMDPTNFVEGVLRFPFFNFESIQGNLFEPQRGLLFSLPVIALVAAVALDGGGVAADAGRAGRRTLWAFVGVCLLPLAHIVAFPVMGLCLVPALWRWRAELWRRVAVWGPAAVLGLLQLGYLFGYGPPMNEHYSGTDVAAAQQLQNFAAVPAGLRRAVFWFFANGDFFGWGLFFLGLTAGRRWLGRGEAARLDPAWALLVRGRWCGAVLAGCFVFINCYRYSYDWGDSNKFVVFVNLGLTLVIVSGAAYATVGGRRVLAQGCWIFLASLCAFSPIYEFHRDVIAAPQGKILLFQAHGMAAARWLRDAAGPNDLVLTAADNTFHYVTALAGAPTLAGLYSESNPYRQPARAEQIRRVYEGGELALIEQLGVRFVSLSRAERRRYRIHPVWKELEASGRGVVFRSGRLDEFDAAIIFDAARMKAGDAEAAR